MDAYKVLNKLSSRQLIELAGEMNTPVFPENSLLRKTAAEVFNTTQDDPFIIVHALGMAIPLCKVLADRLYEEKELSDWCQS